MLRAASAPAWLRAPSQCEVCRQWCRSSLCSDCTARFAAPVPRCHRCGLRTGAPVAACGACLHDPPPFEQTVCLADYAFPWDRLVAAFKFESRPELAGVLAQALYNAVLRAGGAAPDLVLPVPLSAPRLVERGYNQAWELARRCARVATLPARADVLLRPLDTAHQADLGRAARQHNLRQAFMVDPRQRAAVQGRRLALVDDVMTTGATVRESAATLQRAGAAAVQVWVLTRTPVD
jgi:ComF family protein